MALTQLPFSIWAWPRWYNSATGTPSLALLSLNQPLTRVQPAVPRTATINSSARARLNGAGDGRDAVETGVMGSDQGAGGTKAG